jgi:arsenate reductase
MKDAVPGSALFACDWNAVRSPMAEGIAKQVLGTRVFVQSAGWRGEMEVDPFAVAVCAEIGVDIAAHSTHSLDEFHQFGEDIAQYDLIVALSPGAHAKALAVAEAAHVAVEYWPTLDPTQLGDTREQKMSAYRITRDQIRERIMMRFGLLL